MPHLTCNDENSMKVNNLSCNILTRIDSSDNYINKIKQENEYTKKNLNTYYVNTFEIGKSSKFLNMQAALKPTTRNMNNTNTNPALQQVNTTTIHNNGIASNNINNDRGVTSNAALNNASATTKERILLNSSKQKKMLQTSEPFSNPFINNISYNSLNSTHLTMNTNWNSNNNYFPKNLSTSNNAIPNNTTSALSNYSKNQSQADYNTSSSQSSSSAANNHQANESANSQQNASKTTQQQQMQQQLQQPQQNNILSNAFMKPQMIVNYVRRNEIATADKLSNISSSSSSHTRTDSVASQMNKTQLIDSSSHLTNSESVSKIRGAANNDLKQLLDSSKARNAFLDRLKSTEETTKIINKPNETKINPDIDASMRKLSSRSQKITLNEISLKTININNPENNNNQTIQIKIDKNTMKKSDSNEHVVISKIQSNGSANNNNCNTNNNTSTVNLYSIQRNNAKPFDPRTNFSNVIKIDKKFINQNPSTLKNSQAAKQFTEKYLQSHNSTTHFGSAASSTNKLSTTEENNNNNNNYMNGSGITNSNTVQANYPPDTNLNNNTNSHSIIKRNISNVLFRRDSLNVPSSSSFSNGSESNMRHEIVREIHSDNHKNIHRTFNTTTKHYDKTIHNDSDKFSNLNEVINLGFLITSKNNLVAKNDAKPPIPQNTNLQNGNRLSVTYQNGATTQINGNRSSYNAKANDYGHGNQNGNGVVSQQGAKIAQNVYSHSVASPESTYSKSANDENANSKEAKWIESAKEMNILMKKLNEHANMSKNENNNLIVVNNSSNNNTIKHQQKPIKKDVDLLAASDDDESIDGDPGEEDSDNDDKKLKKRRAKSVSHESKSETNSDYGEDNDSDVSSTYDYASSRDDLVSEAAEDWPERLSKMGLDFKTLFTSTTRNENGTAVKYYPPFNASLFVNVPPTIRFITQEDKMTEMPAELKKYLKWKMSSVTPNIVKSTLARSNFRVASGKNDWIGTWGRHMKPELFKSIKIYQKINHYPGSFQIGRKDRLCRNLYHAQSLFGKAEYNFIPMTFVLPFDYNQLKNEIENPVNKNAKWILKPPASARGQGIRVVGKLENIPKKRACVVQKYLSNPYLINGLKFDLRIYVYVSSYDPLRIYIFNDGLTRFASRKYSNSLKTISDKYMHLTNFSINKTNSEYKSNDDENSCIGHKWSLKALWQYLKKQGINTDKIWDNIKDLVVKTIIIGDPHVNVLVKGNLKRKYSVHELFGFDVILDENLKPWIVEVNISPSLHSSSPLDISVKGQMICDLFNLAGHMIPNTKDISEKRKSLVNILTKKLTSFLNSSNFNDLSNKNVPKILTQDKRILVQSLSNDEKTKHHFYISKFNDDKIRKTILDTLTPDDIRVLVETEDEYSRRGYFSCIFPTNDSRKYLKLFETTRYYNILLSEWLIRHGSNRERGVAILNQYCRKKIHVQNPTIVGDHIWSQSKLPFKVSAMYEGSPSTHTLQSASSTNTARRSKTNLVDLHHDTNEE